MTFDAKLYAEANRKLRDAMRKYGFTDADRRRAQPHVTDGRPCWCGPTRLCAECQSQAPCLHGSDRIELMVHKEAS